MNTAPKHPPLPTHRLFILGCAKSGTTWLQNIFAAHPNAACTGEAGLAWRLIPALAQAAAAYNQHQTQFSQPPHCHLSDHNFTELAQAAADILARNAINASEKPPEQLTLVADKTPQHTQSLPTLAALFPHARFINITRDPRDAATSAVFHIRKYDHRPPNEYAKHFIQTIWPANVKPVLDATRTLGHRLLSIRYEDLHANEHDTIAELLAHARLSADPDTVNACQHHASFRTRSGGRNPGDTNPQHFFRNGTVGDHANHFEPAFIRDCCRPIEHLMRQLGYDPDNPHRAHHRHHTTDAA